MPIKNFLYHLTLFCCVIIPSAHAQKTGTEEKPRRPLLGVVHTQAERGVRIEKVMQNSAAARAGLKIGDVILSFNGVTIRNTKHLFTEVQRYKPGEPVLVEYLRAGKTHKIEVVLGEREDISGLVGFNAPDFSLPQLGSNAAYTFIPGKVLILDFWATWCAPCEPVHLALEEFLRQKKHPSLAIIGITNEDEAAVRHFLREHSFTYPILLDEKGVVITDYRITGFPTLVVIDKKGTVRFAGFAAGGGLEEALLIAEKLLKEK